MVIRRLRELTSKLEEIVEEVVLILLSIFVILLIVSALAVFSTQPPAGLSERVAVIGVIASMGFLAKAEYFAALLLPWFLMIIGLMIARELWLVRRRMEGIHFEFVMRRVVKTPRRAAPVRNRRKR